jgi:predicted NAD/FAD-binding protein
MAPTREHRRKVAIIGSGCAGLGAAWALRNTDYEVHIFEKSPRLGGHTNTQPFRAAGTTVQVDTGFIVMNAATYPNFIRFLKEVGVDPVETEMTFGVSRDDGAFEWSGEGQGIFAQRRNLFRPRHWRMIFDIIRFNQFALDLLADDDEGVVTRLGSSVEGRKQLRDLTIGQYLEKEGYSLAFRDDYLIPMTAAVWSTSPDKTSLEFPAHTLVRFMWNHHLLSTLAVRPPWLTIAGGSQRYIDAIVKGYPAGKLHIHTSCEVANILRPSEAGDTGVTVSWIDSESGRIEGDMFHHAILASHGDDVLPLLAKHGSQSKITSNTESLIKSSSGLQYLSQEEFEVFSAFQTTENVCYLHSDLSLMPRRRATWTAWNYLTHSAPSKLAHPAAVSLTYCMNILQHLPESQLGPVLVTMNPKHAPDPALTQGKFFYRHPLYTVEAVHAQKRLDALQNTRGVSYCGAWTKYGFHEDGFSSGLKVAMDHLGAKLPFEFVDSTFSRGHKPDLGWKDYLVRLILMIAMVWIPIIEFFLGLPVVRTVVPLMEAVGSRVLDVAESVGVLKDPVVKMKVG